MCGGSPEGRLIAALHASAWSLQRLLLMNEAVNERCERLPAYVCATVGHFEHLI